MPILFAIVAVAGGFAVCAALWPFWGFLAILVAPVGASIGVALAGSFVALYRRRLRSPDRSDFYGNGVSICSSLPRL